MNYSDKLALIREYKNQGGKGSYLSLLSEANKMAKGGEIKDPPTSPIVSDNTYRQPTAPTPETLPDFNYVRPDNSWREPLPPLKSVPQTIIDNVTSGFNIASKVMNNVVFPAAAGTLALTSGIPAFMGQMYLGNKMADSETTYPEGVATVAGRVPSPFSEKIKTVGGINDLNVAYENFKDGDYWKAVFNTATGLSGVVDTSHLPQPLFRVVDKALELLNTTGDIAAVLNTIAEASGISDGYKELLSKAIISGLSSSKPSNISGDPTFVHSIR